MSEETSMTPSKIASLLQPSQINLAMHATDKRSALQEVAGLLSGHPCIRDFDAFYRDVLQRERVSNTALGHGVALPHARTDQCAEIVIAVGRSTTGVEFDAKDTQPVRLIFLIGTPKSLVTEYLRVVGSLARLLRRADVYQQLLHAPDPAAFIRVLAEAEN
jgi:mannitol/fructose-specific phosphotransferase system IIA component (Ntr-type)